MSGFHPRRSEYLFQHPATQAYPKIGIPYVWARGRAKSCYQELPNLSLLSPTVLTSITGFSSDNTSTGGQPLLALPFTRGLFNGPAVVAGDHRSLAANLSVTARPVK